LTPDLNARIAENKAELVSILASERANGGTDKLGIAPVSRPERLPLSFAQERLWFIEQMRTGETVYNIAQGIRFLGPLDTDVFRQVLTEISRRHEVLRSRFVADETGVPYCEISDPAPFALVFDDASAQDNATRERWIHELATDEMVRPFDIARGPVVRARLIRCAPQEHVFLFTVPHIIFDGWSSGILWREFTTLYEAFVKGMPSPLKDPPLQFWEFATWQRRYFTDERLAAGLDYWTNHLRGAPALMELPTDRPRPAVEGVNGARVTRTLSPRLTQALRDLARRQRATLFTVLLAGFKALLHRYTSQGDILVGVPFAGRSRVETEQTIGLFVNTLVLRTDLTGDPSFLALLERVRIVSLEAFSHGEVPFERLVRILRPRRELAFHPVYQVMFTLEYAPAFNAPETGLEARYLSGRTTAAQVD
jgi:hypothetical protein